MQFFKDLKQSLYKNWFDFCLINFIVEFRQMRLSFLWIGLSHLIFCAGLAFVFYPILGQNFLNHMFYVSIGLAVWNLVQAFVLNGIKFFDANSGYIKSGLVDLHFLALNSISRLILIFIIQLLVFFPLYVFYLPSSYELFFSFIGLILVLFFGYLAGHMLAGIGLLFPDFKELTTSVMRMMFFITPVFWIPADSRNTIRTLLIEYNPFYHLISVIRSPLLGDIAYNSLFIVFLMNLFLLLITPFIYKSINLRALNRI